MWSQCWITWPTREYSISSWSRVHKGQLLVSLETDTDKSHTPLWYHTSLFLNGYQRRSDIRVSIVTWLVLCQSCDIYLYTLIDTWMSDFLSEHCSDSVIITQNKFINIAGVYQECYSRLCQQPARLDHHVSVYELTCEWAEWIWVEYQGNCFCVVLSCRTVF